MNMERNLHSIIQFRFRKSKSAHRVLMCPSVQEAERVVLVCLRLDQFGRTSQAVASSDSLIVRLSISVADPNATAVITLRSSALT